MTDDSSDIIVTMTPGPDPEAPGDGMRVTMSCPPDMELDVVSSLMLDAIMSVTRMRVMDDIAASGDMFNGEIAEQIADMAARLTVMHAIVHAEPSSSQGIDTILPA